jgi:epoxyqueuosine reductase QueG
LIQPVAEAVGATAYYPFDRPWQPFQAWAKAAEGLRASPLGMLIHPQFGLWHGYRGALGFAFMVEPKPFHGAHPCDGCIDKPCLTACPAGAVTPERFDVGLCRDHLRDPAQGQCCMSGGCSARDRCPVGQQYRYPQEQIQFHMRMLGT